ncbi:VanZ family protein [Amycolatopsis sp. NBC_00348]|uniref:VanZ family protein n=1 Tax=Amycolatopsis sp. NBC_00348 TaxID=2975956 RepID=UPI002E276C7C
MAKNALSGLVDRMERRGPMQQTRSQDRRAITLSTIDLAKEIVEVLYADVSERMPGLDRRDALAARAYRGRIGIRVPPRNGPAASVGAWTTPNGGRVLDGWHGWTGTFTGVAVITVAALPLAALAVWVSARRRAWRPALAEVAIGYGTVPWVWLIMLPGSHAGTVPGRVSLVPPRDLLTMPVGQIAGNLLVFAALGFFVPVRFATSVPRVLALAAGLSILLETAQYVLRLDRVSSVDDVLLNAAGAGLAALASRRWWAAR